MDDAVADRRTLLFQWVMLVRTIDLARVNQFVASEVIVISSLLQHDTAMGERYNMTTAGCYCMTL